MIKHINICTQDGLTLAATLYLPEQKAKAGVILNSATAVKQGYYKHFARYLAEHDFLVITYDYRGIGDSAINNPRDRRLTMQAWGELDLMAIIDWGTIHFPDLSWHCIGHSVGGQILGLAANNHIFKSAYCVSSQSGYWQLWESFAKVKMLLMWYAVIPGLSRLLGKVPGTLLGGEQLPEGIARQWAYWGRHEDYIVDAHGSPIREGFERIFCPMKFLLIEDDLDFAPPKAVKALRQFYCNADSLIEQIKPVEVDGKALGHFGFFKKRYQGSLWNDALQWLRSHS
jgi:predicted alpha/beta hydrolase